MSKRLGIEIYCPNCTNQYNTTVYRTIWGEHLENRDLVMSDKINVVTCPDCHERTKVPISLLYVDVEAQFAVWWEPTFDSQIDKDAKEYAKMFGEGNFYQKAPRILDWEDFKQTINKFYSGELKANPIKISPQQQDAFQGMVEGMLKKAKKQNKQKSGCMFILFLIIAMASSLSFISFL